MRYPLLGVGSLLDAILHYAVGNLSYLPLGMGARVIGIGL
jgi:hypothetical protein